MKWGNNIASIINGNGTGKCPFCESANVDFSTHKISGNMGYAVIWCNDCKRAFNMSRLEIKPPFKKENKTPNDLIY